MNRIKLISKNTENVDVDAVGKWAEIVLKYFFGLFFHI